MFEDSLLESTHPLSSRNRWPAIASFAVQAALAAVIVVVPLLHPERLALALPAVTLAPALVPPPPPPAPPVIRAQMESSTDAATVATTAATQAPVPHWNLHPIGIDPEGPPASLPSGIMTSAATGPAGILVSGDRPSVAVATPGPAVRTRISTGVAVGLLIAPIRPVYPPIARAAHVEGVVNVHAFISATGSIESATAVSGPPMLYGSALEAVRAARYKPFLLNGQPVEVETTITINFRLGS